MNTPTPETDACAVNIDQSNFVYHWKYNEEFAWVPSDFARKLERERDMLAQVIEASTILIAAKGRHNTMLAYEGLRLALQSITNFPQTPAK